MSQPQLAIPSFSLISTSLVVDSVVFLVLANAAVALRFYARKIKRLEFKWDDWTIVISLVLSWTYSINTWVTAGLGGVDRTTLGPLEAVVVFERCLWIQGIALGIVLATVKISILLFYRRIFITRAFKTCVDIFIVVLAGWAISIVIVTLLITSPISDSWKGGHIRYNLTAFTLAVSGMSIIFDIMVLTFPLLVIKSLKMPLRRKIQVSGVFWLGGFCCIAAAIRFYYLYEGTQKIFIQAGHNQYTYATPEFIWAHIEPNCSIVAACLPTYGPFVSSKSLDGLIKSIQSFLSRRSDSSRSYRRGAPSLSHEGGDRHDGLAVDDKSYGPWLKLSKLDSTGFRNPNVVDVEGAMKAEEEDLKAQREGTASLKISVKKAFGTEQ